MTTCPKCQRRLDRSWSECPYCKRERDAGLPKKNAANAEQEVEEMSTNEKNPRAATQVETPKSGRETKYQYTGPESEPRRAESSAASSRDNRKIVGILASYTWKPEGEIFFVREGRTHIGAGQIKDDPNHRIVDVHCPDDQTLSEDHAMILVQQRKFWIRDLDSTNGTRLNGAQLRPDVAEELPNNAQIRVGKTDLVFLKIESKAQAEEAHEEPGRREEPEVARSRNPTILR